MADRPFARALLKSDVPYVTPALDFLTNDRHLETAQHVSLGVGLAAGVIATGGLLADGAAADGLLAGLRAQGQWMAKLAADTSGAVKVTRLTTTIAAASVAAGPVIAAGGNMLQQHPEFVNETTALVESAPALAPELGEALAPAAERLGQLAPQITNAIPEIEVFGQATEHAAEATSEVGPSIPELTEGFAATVREQNARLTADIGANAIKYLSKAQLDAAYQAPARTYGIILEKMVAEAIAKNPNLAPYFQYVAGPNSPDWRGLSKLEGLYYELTTTAGAASHFLRFYGENLVMHTYDRPPSVGF
jgi:hypothetical protein